MPEKEELAKSLIESYIKSEEEVQSNIVKEVSKLMNEDEEEDSLRIPDLIELMESNLTSKDDKERNKATQFLSDLIEKNKFDLSYQEIHLFVVFFSHRLSDYPSLIPSLNSLKVLLTEYNDIIGIRASDPMNVLQAIFQSVHVPSYAQSIRHRVLLLIELIMKEPKYTSSLISGGTSIINGILNSMEDEKDPRCLLLSLKLLGLAIEMFPDDTTYLIESENDPKYLYEKAFEYTSCYFPITFSPPPDDPFGIKPEDLIDSLEFCLISSPSIFPLSVPFFIHQINSDQLIGRLHALRALSKIILSHSHKALFAKLESTSNMNSKLFFDSSDGMNKFSRLQQICDIIMELLLMESNVDLLKAAQHLLQALLNSIKLSLFLTNFKETNEWNHFIVPICRKVAQEFTTNISSLRSKNCLTYIIPAMISQGGYLVRNTLLNEVLPIIISKCLENCLCTRDAMYQLISAWIKDIDLSLTPINFDDEKLNPAPLEALHSLLSLIGVEASIPSLSNTLSLSDISIDTKEETVIDFSASENLDAFQAHLNDIFECLTKYLEHFHINVSELMIQQPNAFASALLKHDGNEQGIGMDVVHIEEVKLYPLALNSLLLSISSTKHFLKSGLMSRLKESQIAQYFQHLSGLSLFGFESMVHLENTSEFPKQLLWNKKDNTGLRTICIDFMSSACFDPRTSDLGFQFFLEPLDLLDIESRTFRPSFSIIQALLKSSPDATLMRKFADQIYSTLESLSETFRQTHDPIRRKSSFEDISMVMKSFLSIFLDENDQSNSTLLHSATQEAYVSNAKINFLISHEVIIKKSPDSNMPIALAIYMTVLNLIESQLFDCDSMEETASFFHLVQLLMDYSRRLVLSIQIYTDQNMVLEIISTRILNSWTSMKGKNPLVSEMLYTFSMTHLLIYADKNSSLFCESEPDSDPRPGTSNATLPPLLDLITQMVFLSKEERITQDLKGIFPSQYIENYGPYALIGIVINKMHGIPTLDHFLRSIIHPILDSEKMSALSLTDSEMKAFLWSFKALLMRPNVKFNDSQSWLDKYFEILCSMASQTLSDQRKVSFYSFLAILFQENPFIFKKQSRGHYSPLWKQKLWSRLLPSLLDIAQAFVEREQSKSQQIATLSASKPDFEYPFGLIMLFEMVQHVPPSLLTNSFEKLKDLNIYVLTVLDKYYLNAGLPTSLVSRSPEPIIHASINLLNKLFQQDIQAFSPYLDLVIPFMLKVALQGQIARLRSEALHTLDLLTDHIPYSQLHPYVKNVTLTLKRCLDDPKRAIRHIAMKTRNKWILLK